MAVDCLSWIALENSVMKMRVLRVDAALRRGDPTGQTDRRSGDSGPTIGSHTPPKTAVFICGGDLE